MVKTSPSAMKMDADADEQSLSGTTLAESTFSTDTIVPSQPSEIQTEHRFYKGNGLSSKATVRSSDGTEYQLVADIHKTKPSTIQMFAGKNSRSPPSPLGTLEFPHTYNNFQITTDRLIQVRARVGHPHPSSYAFTLPSTTTSRPQNVTWMAFGRDAHRTGYHLREEETNALIATWYLVAGQKHQAVLRWHREMEDEGLRIAVVLSFIGSLSRLKLKGKDDSEKGSGLARWNGMWFMAILGTAAVA